MDMQDLVAGARSADNILGEGLDPEKGLTYPDCEAEALTDFRASILVPPEQSDGPNLRHKPQNLTHHQSLHIREGST